ncbi:MAG: hypothetical protein LBB38_01655, partial [Puniceicoccales bacterium]|nr:hypothetical protein [Puniceicoccales bacterium]
MEPVSGKAVTSPLRLFLLASAMALSMSSPSATCAVVGGISLTVGYPSDPEEIVYDSDHGTQGVDFSERIIAGNSSYGIRFTGASDIKSSIIDAGGTVILNVDKDAGIFIGNEDAVTPGAYRTAIDFNGLSGATANPVSITFYEDGSHEISAYLNGVGCAGLGAGAAWNTCPEPFNWWYIGGMKNSAVSVTSSACAATYGLGLSAASDFPDSSFCNWTFGKFLSGNSICAVAKETNPSATAYATTFGAAYVNTVKESQFKNWSVEFSGNQTIAALAYCNNDGFNVAANCLGGWTNEDMRFYFNGEGSEDETPKVQVVGARFSAINFVTGAVYPDHPVVPFEPIAPKPKPPQQILRQAPLDASWISYVDLSFSSNQDDTRAISMGNGFQLNVGRTRAMEDGSETDSSKAGGGETASVNHGVLNLIGAVARTPYLTASGVAPSDTVMRIDGGWTVNCFGNVRDLRNIDLIDGKLVLVNANPGDKNWHVFEEAANAFERSVAIRGPLAIYRGAGNGDDGGGDNYYVALDHSHYPVRGSLSISESDTVTFHIPENSIGGDYDQDKLYPLRAAGTIELLGAENGMINFETGWNFNLDTESLASGQSDMANCAFIVLVEAPAGTDENAIGGLNFGHLNGEYMISSAEGFGFKDDASVSLSRAAKTIKSIPDEFALYWFTNPVLSGLALAPRSDETLAGFRDNTYGIKLSGTDTNFPNEIILDKGGHNLYVTISVCDPMLTNGDYGIKFGDSLKNIHWKASLDLKFTNESNSQAAVLKVTADGDKATVIDFNGLNGTEKFPICVTFDPDNWNNEISARATNDNYGNAVVFGGCSITGSANSYNNWKVGGLKNSNILAAGTARAAAFGASYVDGTPNSFCNWSIDGVSGCAAATSVYNFDSLVALTVFGAADAHGNQTNSFCNWSFNNFQDGNSICALAYGGRLLPNVAAFGPGYAGDATMKGSFKNWSAEFSGSQTIATLANGLSSSSVAVNCLGGWANEDMRFYFNCVARDKETNPTVNIAAVKLSSVNPNGSSESIVLTLSGKQGNDEAWGADSVNKDYVYDKRGWARALSIGNGFQLNVGRTRILDSYGRETADSISYGGKTDPSYWAGTVNLIGAVARSPELACAGSRPENTTLRIDNGWIVKCFGPVKDLRTIDLINGCLALVNCDASESHIKSDSEDDDHWSVFLDAARSLEAGLAIVDGDKFYRGGINEADLYPDRDGYVELSYEGYPVRGSLTMSSGDRLLVHLNSNAFNFAESYDSLFASAAAGTIYLAGENEMLFLEDGWNISWGDIPLPWNALLLVAIGEPHTPHSVVNGLSFAYAGTYGVSDDPSGDGPLLTGKGNKTVDL